MLFDLIKKYRGKETVVMTDTRTKCNDRRKALINGNRGQRVEYTIRESKSESKLDKGRAIGYRGGGDAQRGPRLVKWTD